MLFTSLFDESAARDSAIDPAAVGPLYACSCQLCCGSQSAGLQGLLEPQYGIAPGQPLSASISVPPATSAADSATLMSGSLWTGTTGGKTVITYSFANAGSQYAASASSFRASLVEFSAQDKVLTRALLDSIAAVCNVSFVELADGNAQSGQVRYAYSQAPNDMGYAGFAYFPSPSEIGGDVWIEIGRASCRERV